MAVLAMTLGGCQILLADNPRFIDEQSESSEAESGSQSETGIESEGGNETETGASSDSTDSNSGSGDDEDEDGDDDCQPGWIDCTDEPGCETEVDSVEHCGECNHACLIGDQIYTCDAGECQANILFTASADVTIDASESMGNFEGEEFLRVSTMPKRDTLIDFELPEFPLDAYVESATLTLHSELGGGPVFSVHRITESWDPDSVTWEQRPEAMKGPETVAELGEFEIDIPEITQRWVDGTPAYGLSLRTNKPGDIQLRAIEGGFSPRLDVSLSW